MIPLAMAVIPAKHEQTPAIDRCTPKIVVNRLDVNGCLSPVMKRRLGEPAQPRTLANDALSTGHILDAPARACWVVFCIQIWSG